MHFKQIQRLINFCYSVGKEDPHGGSARNGDGFKCIFDLENFEIQGSTIPTLS